MRLHPLPLPIQRAHLNTGLWAIVDRVHTRGEQPLSAKRLTSGSFQGTQRRP
jgi:hypothetical protein